jgi:hypothetical protein
MWSSHDLDLVVWLGVNDIWPVRMVRSDGTRHMDFEYEGPEPRDLIDQYFQRGNTVRKVLDIYGRVRKMVMSASQHGGQEVPFEKPLR